MENIKKEGERNPQSGYLISYLKMRKVIGWLGILLPFILLFGNYIVNELNILNNKKYVKIETETETKCYNIYSPQGCIKSSISHYYYTTVGELFTGVLCAVAIFLFCYKGYKNEKWEKGPTDNLMANLAGFFALGVVAFPTSSEGCILDNVRIFLSSEIIGCVHLIFAALFFITLALMSIINFRRTGVKETYGKGEYQKLYVWCGGIMIACIVLIAVYNWCLEDRFPILKGLYPVLVLETIALMAFGISWLTKGKVDYVFTIKKLKIWKQSLDKRV